MLIAMLTAIIDKNSAGLAKIFFTIMQNQGENSGSEFSGKGLAYPTRQLFRITHQRHGYRQAAPGHCLTEYCRKNEEKEESRQGKIK